MNVRYSITLKSEKLTYMKMLMGCKPELQRQYNNTVARLKGYRTLEPYEAKVSRTVLKGLETGNGLRLLNSVKIRQIHQIRVLLCGFALFHTGAQSVAAFLCVLCALCGFQTNKRYKKAAAKF